jgi:tRNA-binding protein
MDFLKVDMRAGTILDVKINDKARTPAYVLTVDFGELGIKTASAQITEAYDREGLIGVQVVAVVNFPPKRVAGIRSEVLILAVVQEGGQTILLRPTQGVANGSRVA